MKKIIIILIALTSFLSAKMQVCVSILPQAFFVEKVAQDLVDVEVLVKPGASPATYTPKPSQLKLISNAPLYFTIGVAFEKNWLPRFTAINENMKLVDTTTGIKKLEMQSGIDTHEHHDHHGHDHDHHTHEGLDPHIWLDPMLVKIQVATIAQALAKEDPQNSNFYLKNAQTFTQELEKISLDIQSRLKDIKQKEFIVFHPAFGYFANAFGLKQIAIEKEGKEPSVKYIKRIIDFAHEHKIKTIFVAPQFSQKSAKQIAKRINGQVKSINPLSRDWDKNILDIAKSFEN
ncbi:MAG: zinc ABC transporter substrate-binding protein [Epsilonproteobacteria bacterium]|nr:zinc ABC transporter substrate-binding protein [Campylobacterota bacterium]